MFLSNLESHNLQFQDHKDTKQKYDLKYARKFLIHVKRVYEPRNFNKLDKQQTLAHFQLNVIIPKNKQ